MPIYTSLSIPDSRGHPHTVHAIAAALSDVTNQENKYMSILRHSYLLILHVTNTRKNFRDPRRPNCRIKRSFHSIHAVEQITNEKTSSLYVKQALKRHAFTSYSRPWRIVTKCFVHLRCSFTYLLTYNVHSFLTQNAQNNNKHSK